MSDDQNRDTRQSTKEQRRAWVEANRAHLREYHRQWRQENRDRLRDRLERRHPQVRFTATPAHLALAQDDPARLAIIDALAKQLREAKAIDFRHDAQGFGFTVRIKNTDSIPGIRQAMAGHYEVEVIS